MLPLTVHLQCPRSFLTDWLPLFSSFLLSSCCSCCFLGLLFSTFCFVLLRLLPFAFVKTKNPKKNSFLCWLLAFCSVLLRLLPFAFVKTKNPKKFAFCVSCWRLAFGVLRFVFVWFGGYGKYFGGMGTTSLSVNMRKAAERVVAQLDGDEGKSSQASDGFRPKS